jgi:hypothetical protein
MVILFHFKPKPDGYTKVCGRLAEDAFDIREDSAPATAVVGASDPHLERARDSEVHRLLGGGGYRLVDFFSV